MFVRSLRLLQKRTRTVKVGPSSKPREAATTPRKSVASNFDIALTEVCKTFGLTREDTELGIAVITAGSADTIGRIYRAFLAVLTVSGNVGWQRFEEGS